MGCGATLDFPVLFKKKNYKNKEDGVVGGKPGFPYVLFKKKNYKNKEDGVRGNLRFPC